MIACERKAFNRGVKMMLWIGSMSFSSYSWITSLKLIWFSGLKSIGQKVLILAGFIFSMIVLNFCCSL